MIWPLNAILTRTRQQVDKNRQGASGRYWPPLHKTKTLKSIWRPLCWCFISIAYVLCNTNKTSTKTLTRYKNKKDRLYFLFRQSWATTITCSTPTFQIPRFQTNLSCRCFAIFRELYIIWNKFIIIKNYIIKQNNPTNPNSSHCTII